LNNIISDITRLVRRHHISYDQLRHIFKQVRRNLGLSPNGRSKRLPRILADQELASFFRVIEDSSLSHKIMLKLLFYTGLRVSELVNIKVSDIDIKNNKIFINQGKGAKDRYVLFPESFRLALEAYLSNLNGRQFLFESSRGTKYTPRRIQQLVSGYMKTAGIATDPSRRLGPHILRHQFLTYLTRKGLSDAQIQLISGHSTKKSLEVYQHLSLKDVEKQYQEAWR
jgi:integrase